MAGFAALCGLLTSAALPGVIGTSAAATSAPTTLTYCAPHGYVLKLDLYRPAGHANAPVVIQIHGGAWRMHNRKTGVTPGLVNAFLERGIALATIDYRLNDAPHAIEDVACAVRYLRASAAKLKIDAGHIGAMGQSAGGQLASLLGAADRPAGFDVGRFPKQSSRVQAVVDEWGPVVFDRELLQSMQSIPKAFKTADLSKLAKYSPLTYLTSDDPPFLLVHGAEDKKVPPSQSRRFAAALRAHAVPRRLIIVARASHGLAPIDGTPQPTAAQVQTSVVEFFANNLR